MKSLKVKKSPAILGLSKRSKDKLKTKKKPKDLRTSLRNVLAKHFSEEKSESSPSVLKDNVKIVNKKANRKGKSPKQLKKIKGNTKTDSGVKVKPKEKRPAVLQKVDYIDSKKVIVAVQALLNHVKTRNKNALFKSEGTPILAQFETVAIPKHPKTTLRFVLPHSPHSKVSDVLLIIPDEKKHHRKLRHDDEMYIVNFEAKLKELGVTTVNKVMTLRQIRAEYYTYEMRRKLSDMYDVFLVDGKIACKLSSLIGKFFYVKNKTPIPVSFEKDDKVKLEVERALRKTQVVLKSSCCTNSVVRIGHSDMSPKELSENLEAFSKSVDTSKYPGGWRNVKKVHIKTPTSTAFPVYYSFVTPNEIENAELKQTLPKHCVAVKGELSTIGRDVTVKPDGSIEVEGVDDIKSLMHQLYRHAGFKDHQDLDLTNAEYKELVRELRKHIIILPKKETENRSEPDEEDVADLMGGSEEDEEEEDEDEDDSNSIEGDMQREDNVHADFEDNEREEEEEEGVEASYMKQWEETWMNEEEEEKGKKKGNKQHAAAKNVKNVTTKNRKQQGQNAAVGAAQGGSKRKRNQGNESGEHGGKKAKPKEAAAQQTKKSKPKESVAQQTKKQSKPKESVAQQTKKQSKAKESVAQQIAQKKENKKDEKIKNVDRAESGKGKINKLEAKGKKKQGISERVGEGGENIQNKNQGGKGQVGQKSKAGHQEGKGQGGQKSKKDHQGGKGLGEQLQKSKKEHQGGKGQVGQKSKADHQGGLKAKTSKKDTPLRQKGGVLVDESNSEVAKRRRKKKAGAPAPNFIPL